MREIEFFYLNNILIVPEYYIDPICLIAILHIGII